MKFGITRLSGNITDRNSNIIGNYETLKIAELLKKYTDIDILTCNECKDCIHIDENYDINQYDRLLIVNDSANMFGGAEIKTMTTIYKLLAKYDKPIYYILTDLNLPFVNYWEIIKNKPWNNYKEEDFKLKFPINIISQGRDLNTAIKIHKNKVTINCVYYVPLNEWGAFLLKPVQNNNRPVDLIYGGSFRGGKREKKLIDYYFLQNNLNVELYGTIRLDQFKKLPEGVTVPTFAKKVPADKIVEYNSKALATVIIGDKDYQDNMVTLRFIEALLSDCICFIDHDFDKNHYLMPEPFYVHNGLELNEKINKLKTDINYYNSMLAQQRLILQNIVNQNMPEKLYHTILGA